MREDGPTDLAGAAEFLVYDLCDSADVLFDPTTFDGPDYANWLADVQRRADLLQVLAAKVERLEPALLAEYAAARRAEREMVGDGPDAIHCSMTMAVGASINPRSIEDLVRIYIRAVAVLRTKPEGFGSPGDMRMFWRDFECAIDEKIAPDGPDAIH